MNDCPINRQPSNRAWIGCSSRRRRSSEQRSATLNLTIPPIMRWRNGLMVLSIMAILRLMECTLRSPLMPSREIPLCSLIQNVPGIMSGFPKIWASIVRRGGLPSDLTPHVLRHSFASLAADLGFSEPTIAALIGHASHSVTSRYVHSADAVLLAAADTVAKRIALLMAGA